MIAIDLSKQQFLDGDPRAIQQIHFTANLDSVRKTTMFFIIEKTKETVIRFASTIKVLQVQLNAIELFEFYQLHIK